MAFRLKILPRQRLAIITYFGDVTRGDFDAVFGELSSAPDFEWSFDEIALFAPDADLASLNFESVVEEARRFKTTHESVTIANDRRSAIVVSNQVQVLGARMFLAYIASNPPPHVEFKLFGKMGMAIAWIEDGRPANSIHRRIDRAEVESAVAEIERARRADSGSDCIKTG
jgi:hypothetical protein